MATIIRGRRDKYVKDLKHAMDLYEKKYPSATAVLYRHGAASVRIRIVDERFKRWSKGRRHDHVWNFLAERLDNDTLQEMSILLLLAPAEQASSFLNSEFDEPIPSRI